MRSKSFTLVELLTTISILGLLAGFAIPAIRAGRETAEVGGCMSNLRQLTTAMLAMGADNQGTIPSGVWANDMGNNLSNGALWSGGYVQNAKVFLCPHGRKSGPPWFGSPVCNYSLNVTPENPINSGFIRLNRIQNPSRAIILFEEAILSGAQTVDSRAWMDTNAAPDTGDAVLFTEKNGMSNHRKKGCVSFYDGSAIALTAVEWQAMLNTRAKRQIYYAAP